VDARYHGGEGRGGETFGRQTSEPDVNLAVFRLQILAKFKSLLAKKNESQTTWNLIQTEQKT